jgi:hypothetical protein
MSPIPERINVDWDDEEALPGAWMGNAYDAPMEGRAEYIRSDLAMDRDVVLQEVIERLIAVHDTCVAAQLIDYVDAVRALKAKP